MCVTHGMPCVNMHGTLRAINRRAQIQFGQAANSVRGGSIKEEEEGRKGEEKGRKGEEKERKGKEKGKKKREEERGGREEKERERGRSVAQLVDPDGKEPGTALQEVGFLLLRLFYA